VTAIALLTTVFSSADQTEDDLAVADNEVVDDEGGAAAIAALASNRSLRAIAASGAKWALFGFGLSQAMRLATNIVLADLLLEESFALMGLVAATMQGLYMLSDIGVGLSVVQSKRGDDQAFLDTAWTVQVLRSVLLALIAVAIAWPLAAWLETRDPAAGELRYLLPFVAVNMLIDGMQSTKLRSATRHLAVRTTVSIELLGQFVSAAASILVAIATRSVWALPVGGLVSSLLVCALSHWFLPGRGNRPRWERAALRELWSFGGWILASTMVTFLALQLDRFVFTAVFPLREVGVYSIAAGIGMMVPALLGKLQSTLAMPLYARMLARGTPVNDCLARIKHPLAALGGYLVAGVIACSPALIATAYAERYAMAGVYLPILAAGAWFAGLDGTYGAAFLALGRPRAVAMVNVVKVGSFALLLWPCIHLGGLLGAVIALAASDAIKYAFAAMIVGRTFGSAPILADLRDTVFIAAVSAVVLFGGEVLADAIGLAPALRFLLQAFVVTLLFAPSLWAASRMLRAQRGDEPSLS
jgi:O-antigen/teichoic acid export membrane protein